MTDAQRDGSDIKAMTTSPAKTARESFVTHRPELNSVDFDGQVNEVDRLQAALRQAEDNLASTLADTESQVLTKSIVAWAELLLQTSVATYKLLKCDDQYTFARWYHMGTNDDLTASQQYRVTSDICRLMRADKSAAVSEETEKEDSTNLRGLVDVMNEMLTRVPLFVTYKAVLTMHSRSDDNGTFTIKMLCQMI